MKKRRMSRREIRRARERKKAGLAITSLAVILLCGTLSYRKINLDAENKKLKEEETALKKRKKELENKDEEIKAYEEYVHSKEYIEYLARTKLGLIYPNEILFQAEED